MSGMNATYCPEDNKLRLYAATRLDEATYQRVREAGFRWAPRQQLFVAPMWTPHREDLLLELCGEVGDEDTSLVERAESRADRFSEFSTKRAQDARAARDAVSSITDKIPLGQPILVGHHSERRARKDAERIENGMRRAVSMWETSQYWRERANGALRHAKYKERPDVRQRRIKRIEADRRKQTREIEQLANLVEVLCNEALTYDELVDFVWSTSLFDLRDALVRAPEAFRETCAKQVANSRRYIAHCERWLCHYDNRLAYERAMLGEQGGAASGRFANIKVGGHVKMGSEWYLVRRINRSNGKVCSVTVNAKYVPVRGIEEVEDYRAPSADDAKAAQAANKMPPLCNYPGEGFEHLTSAEWNATYVDYKGSRELGQGAVRPGGYRPDVKASDERSTGVGRHRVRVIVRRGALIPVFLTDKKLKEPGPAKPEAPEPAPVQPAPVAVGECRTCRDPAVATRVAECQAEGEDFAKLREQLREGVQTLAAPQLFPTPVDLAERMVGLADIGPTHDVLEPSAGSGNLLRAIQALPDGVGSLTAVEIQSALCAQLEAAGGAEVVCADFLTWNKGTRLKFDRIVMNPPFAKAFDIKHIMRAYWMLRAGGRLVGLCADGPRQQDLLRDFVERSGGVWETLPAGTFSEAGTLVSVALVVMAM